MLRFLSKQVLFDIDIQIKQGKKTAIVGESGSGKTVLAQGIMQLNPAVVFTGELCYQGKNVLGQTARQLQKLRGKEIGMVFQEPMTALNPVMQVETNGGGINLAFGFRTASKHGQKRWICCVKQGFMNPNKKPLFIRFNYQVTKRQRAMIAMRLRLNQNCWIADEPTTALDVAVQAQIWIYWHNYSKIIR